MDEALRADLKKAGNDGEARLIDAAVGGDAHAFATLYDQHLERVYRYLYYWTHNQADAEDLAQQVFLQAWQAIRRFKREGASFVAWLLTIAHNLVMSFFRKGKETHFKEVEPVSVARWADPEATTLAKDDRQAVQKAILRLKPEQQQVVVMRFVEHFDYADIAVALGKSEGNIRVIQHRALSELRRLLGPEVNV